MGRREKSGCFSLSVCLGHDCVSSKAPAPAGNARPGSKALKLQSFYPFFVPLAQGNLFSLSPSNSSSHPV